MQHIGIAHCMLGSDVCHEVTRCFINAAEYIITQSTENWGGQSTITSLNLWPVCLYPILMWQYGGYR